MRRAHIGTEMEKALLIQGTLATLEYLARRIFGVEDDEAATSAGQLTQRQRGHFIVTPATGFATVENVYAL